MDALRQGVDALAHAAPAHPLIQPLRGGGAYGDPTSPSLILHSCGTFVFYSKMLNRPGVAGAVLQTPL